MRVSSLLSAITRKPWFIRESDALSQDVIVMKILGGEYSVEDFSKIFSDSNPLKVSLNNGEKIAASSAGFNNAPDGSVAIIRLTGTMLKYGTWCSYGTAEIAEAINEAAASPKIKAIVIDADSGGGAVDAIAPIFDAIINARKSKPVVGCVDLCASACYYALLPCDEIIAGNDISAEIGSIGVMMQFQDMVPYLEEQKIKVHTIYSSLSDYKNRPLELAKQGKYDEIIAEELDPLALKFQNAVKQYRGGKLDEAVAGLLAGKMFYANQAKQIGLIDDVQSLEYAVMRASDMADKVMFDNYVKSKS